MLVTVEKSVRTFLKKINLWFRPVVFRWFVIPWLSELEARYGTIGPMQFFRKEVEKIADANR
jgi:hypothetical protein